MSQFETAKFNMIEQQIRPWEVISPRVLQAFNDLDRHEFVPEQYQSIAYADCQIPLGVNQSMLKPTIEGRLIQSLNIQSHETCLEIGTGSGYLTACLSQLAKSVHSIEIDEGLFVTAQKTLSSFKNITLFNGNVFEWLGDRRMYDVIAVSGAVAAIPESFKNALAINGRMFVAVGVLPVIQAQLITRIGKEQWVTESLFETDLPYLIQS